MKVNVKFDAFRSFWWVRRGRGFYLPKDKKSELFMFLGEDYSNDDDYLINAVSLVTGTTTFFKSIEVIVVDNLEIRRCENNQ